LGDEYEGAKWCRRMQGGGREKEKQEREKGFEARREKSRALEQRGASVAVRV